MLGKDHQLHFENQPKQTKPPNKQQLLLLLKGSGNLGLCVSDMQKGDIPEYEEPQVTVNQPEGKINSKHLP